MSSNEVVVVGSGAAGLSAAIEAASWGAHVTVLEAADALGGASVISGASTCVVGSALQAHEGVTDSLELALADIAAMGDGEADLEWAEQYLRNSNRDVFEWLGDLGITWARLNKPSGNSVARNHIASGWGRAIVAALEARAEQLGVAIRTRSRVTAVSANTDQVVVQVSQDGKPAEALRASAVVFATGGFAGDLDQILEHAQEFRAFGRILAGGAPTAAGLGHDVLKAIGSKFVGLGRIWTYPIGTPDPMDPSGRRGLALRGAITDLWLNSDGERFHDESDRSGRDGTTALLRQRNQTAWSLFSAKDLAAIILMNNEYYSTPVASNPESVEEFLANSEFAARVSSPSEVASMIGAPAGVVEETLDRFNALLAGGESHDPVTGRALTGLNPLTLDDLVVVQVFPIASKNLGGVATDANARVLREDGRHFERVFAAGELAGGAGGSLSGAGSIEGTLFGPSVYSGRVAGRNAAQV